MGPVHTLHEFALNLLGDSQALAHFNADPQGTLNAAGLSGVSPADVHEILPLVADTAPASVTDSLGSFAAPGGVSGLESALPAADALSGLPNLSLTDLPNLSGVFGAVSGVAEQTGLNTVTDHVLHTTSHLVDGVADAVHDVPLVGPVLGAGAIDLDNTVDAVGEHLHDGKLVGALVDATTNHLGDALMPGALVEGVSSLPAVGEPVGGLLNDLRYEGGAALGTVNEAIGSTPVGVHSGQALAEQGHLTDLHSVLGAVTGSVATHAGELPVAGGAVSGLVSTVSGLTSTVTGQTGDFDARGDVSDTLDHGTTTAPAASVLPAAIPAVPAAIPALPALPTTGGIADTMAHTDAVGGHLSSIGGAVSSVGFGNLPDVQHAVVDHVSDVADHSASATDLTGHASGLNIGGHADGLDQHHTGGLLGDGLHLGL